MRNSGFTIIELMVASAILAIVMVFTMQIFTINNRAYVKVDSIVDTQQSVRAIASIFERDLRHAGMMVPEIAGICGIDNTSAPDVVYISDHTAINPVSAIGTFDGARVVGGVTQVNSGITTLGLDSLVIEPDTPDPSYDTDGNGVNDSDFNDNGGGVIIADLMDPDRGTVCGTVENVNIATKSITIDIKSNSFDTAGTAMLIAVPAIEYRIDSNRLYRNNLILAEGVEDLQLAYFLDTNGNNALDVGEMYGISGNNYVAKDSDVSDLRGVRFNVVTRTRSEDERFTQGFFQATENRDAVAGQDGYRRRVHTAIVRMRNIGDRVGGT
ncbi:MAG: prepilin-type N-terminal cleavage/methylation domain-containing protein [Deltaproteobacteria bacterium]|jgi:prepilin-type N-terminal cleavage/methylation domain-containing protein|nr:prepilin-type N-terminal cleavage/methylation domain-containing protein [Deltaproteobacteria bacterium]